MTAQEVSSCEGLFTVPSRFPLKSPGQNDKQLDLSHAAFSTVQRWSFTALYPRLMHIYSILNISI
jgi:hypothetical protein